jgi:hypothetical protein
VMLVCNCRRLLVRRVAAVWFSAWSNKATNESQCRYPQNMGGGPDGCWMAAKIETTAQFAAHMPGFRHPNLPHPTIPDPGSHTNFSRLVFFSTASTAATGQRRNIIPSQPPHGLAQIIGPLTGRHPCRISTSSPLSFQRLFTMYIRMSVEYLLSHPILTRRPHAMSLD